MRKNSLMLIAVCATLLWAGVARANATRHCQETKLRAQAELVHCLALASVAVILGGGLYHGHYHSAVLCRNRFTEELKRIDDVAAKEGTSCRYIDNGDGTVSDLNTGLMWEKTVGTVGGANTGAINDVNNAYTWPAASTQFLAGLDGRSNDYGPNRIKNCFANRCDWRLPSIAELRGIVDLSATGCGSGSACIDPKFGPTQNGFDWSATNLANGPSYAWAVNFFGNLLFYFKTSKFYVRAVRGGL